MIQQFMKIGNINYVIMIKSCNVYLLHFCECKVHLRGCKSFITFVKKSPDHVSETLSVT